MITLITGIPGTGKTAYAVKTLIDLARDRPIYSNINGLAVDHFPIDADWIAQWHHKAPHEAIIVIDECQHHFPPRSTQSKPPEHVAALNTHRHQGVDFILITQRPNLIDYAVKGLVERYIHVRKTSLTRMIHEAPEVVDFAQKSTRQEYASVPYKLPKQVFSLYKSAEVHTKKQRARLPSAALALMALIPIFGGLSWLAYSRLAEKTNLSNQTAAQGSAGGLPTAGPALPASEPLVTIPKSLIEATTPTDVHNPLSAPLYAAVAPPPTAPQVQGCIANARKCTCYSQQQTPVWLPDEQCRQRAAGEYYDPYPPPPPASQTQTAYAHQQDSKATAPAGGLSRPTQSVESPPSSPPTAGEAPA